MEDYVDKVVEEKKKTLVVKGGRGRVGESSAILRKALNDGNDFDNDGGGDATPTATTNDSTENDNIINISDGVNESIDAAAASHGVLSSSQLQLVVAEAVDDDDAYYNVDGSDDDDDIEESVNKELEQLGEDEIRERILREEAQQAKDVIIVKVEDSGQNQDASSAIATLWNAICCIVIFIVVVVVVVVTLVLRSGTNKLRDSAAHKDETFRDQVLKVLGPKYNVDDGRPNLNIVEEVGTPQNQAFEWILSTMESLDVPPVLGIAGGNDTIATTTSEDVNDEQLKQRLLMERYVMAVVYYSTTDISDDEGVEGSTWIDSFGFMNETQNVCDWYEIDGISKLGVWSCDEFGHITSLNLYANNLNGTVPYEISWLQSLQSLDMSWNLVLHGTMPPELVDGSISRLNYISFAKNQLSGTLPSRSSPSLSDGQETQGSAENDEMDDDYWGSKVPEIRTLDFQNNAFSGTIPSSLLKLERLTSLNLSINRLTGTVPDTFRCSDLHQLLMTSNMLSGTVIPTSITKLLDLESLMLHANMLEGSIPTEIGALIDLATLSLYGNQISGSIPTEIGLASDLEYIDLAQNNLVGSIPTELGLLRGLDKLWLSDNMLTGPINDQVFTRLSRLTGLILSGNRLTGTLPTTLANMMSVGECREFVLGRNFVSRSYCAHPWIWVAIILVAVHIQNNSFVGDLDPLVCHIPNIDARADCLVQDDSGSDSMNASTGLSPEIACTCCRQCCNDVTGCSPYTGLEACLIQREIFGGSANCNCTPVVNTSDQVFGASERPDIHYEMSCSLPFCKHCDAFDDNCAFLTWGRFYDRNGNNLGDFQRYKYFSGVYKDREVLTTTINPYCEVQVDGGVCNGCWHVRCPDGYSTVQVQCENVQPRQPRWVGDGGLEYDGCFSQELPAANTSSSVGELQVLLTQYDECKPYTPGYCQQLKEYIQIISHGTSCHCSDDGLHLTCQQGACKYCFYDDFASKNTSYHLYIGTNSAEDNADCFVDTTIFELAEETWEYVWVTSHYQYISSLSNSTNDKVGSIVTISTATFDESCVAMINGEGCRSCTRILCSSSDEELKLQVDCGNLMGANTTLGVDERALSFFDGCDETSWEGGRLGVLQALRPLPQCIPENVTQYFS